MECKEAHILFIPHIMGDPGQYHRLEAHLLSCQACKEGYETRQQTIAFIEQHEDIFADALKTSQERKAVEKEEIERSWECIEVRWDEFESQERKEKQANNRRFLVRVSVVAACLVMGISVLLAFLICSKPKIVPKSITRQVAHIPKPSVRIEWVLKNDKVPILANQQITSNDKLKTLIINGKHQMIMNAGTVLSIEPISASTQLGCLVKLTAGEIYAHVEHDGNPFEVQAPHGKAVITGTVFDVSVTDDETTLVVAEGSVRFESDLGTVDVLANQKSQLRAQFKPTEPLACNANQLIAWSSQNSKLIQNQIEDPALDDMIDLLTNESLASNLYSSVSQPIDLESLDYDEFVEGKRKWFKTQFPWIFELKKVLNDKGIDIDYPELLIKTGDIWQIVYPERLYRIIPVIDPNTILAVTEEYELGKAVYAQIVASASKYQTLQNNMALGVDALKEWMADIKRIQGTCNHDKDIEILCESSQTYGDYLANTRALSWLSIKTGRYQVPEIQNKTVLQLLEEIIETLCDFQRITLQLDLCQLETCSEESYEQFHKTQQLLESICDHETNLSQFLDKHQSYKYKK
ncbi:MAG: FecR domain-containing protein [Planctomycetota bacterium]|jgi:ferric-dicitrate binding protein FerR (iron transport regulator)